MTALRTMQKKINSKFKDCIPDLLLSCSESNATQIQVDHLYHTLFMETLSSVGSQFSQKILNLMQKAYDKELAEESNSTESDLDFDLDLKPKKRLRSRKREYKAETKARKVRVRMPWTDDETEKLIEALKKHGRNWHKVAAHVATKRKFAVRKQAKLLRKEAEENPELPGSEVLLSLRFTINKESSVEWTEDEKQRLIESIRLHGRQWSKVSAQFSKHKI